MVKRLSTSEDRAKIQAEAKFKGKDEKNLTDKDIRELVILIAKKLNLI